MRQIALDIGLSQGPTLGNFLPGPNEAAWQHLQLWIGSGTARRSRSPVPTYLWGPAGSGKTHLLRALRAALQATGEPAGWLDASISDPGPFDEAWAAVLLDDVHLYTAAQQQVAFNWFVQAQAQQRAVLAAGALAPAGLALREDLRSRLGWGHLYALQPLSEAQCRDVLRQTAAARGIVLADEVMDYLLARFSRGLGNLMELLDLIDGYALQTQRPVTIPLIRAMMDEA